MAGLYALNTAGAVAGSLLAGFVLVRAVGVHGTLWIAVAVNAGVAALAFALSRGERAAERDAAPEPSEPAAERSLLVALVLAGVAGWALTRFVFDGRFALPLLPLVALGAIVIGLTVVVGLANSRDVLLRPPLEVLRAE